MIVHKAIVFRVKPTARQRDLLERHFGHNRFVWNYFLQKRMAEYEEEKITSNYYRDAAELTRLKRAGEYAWLYEVSANSLQRTLRHLDTAFQSFFSGVTGFPRFKSKGHKQSFTQVRSILVSGKRIYFYKFRDGLKFNRDLPEFTKINNLTIRKTATGNYYAVLKVEAEGIVKPKTGESVGIDLGLLDFAVFSDGTRIKAPKFFHQQQVKLKRAQQHLSRIQKGSNFEPSGTFLTRSYPTIIHQTPVTFENRRSIP
jgi:putative transposase